MAEKTSFSNLVPDQATSSAPIHKDQRACVNCAHSRVPVKMEVAVPYVLCKKGPPSVLVEPAMGQLKISNRWPAMGLNEECDSFDPKKMT